MSEPPDGVAGRQPMLTGSEGASGAGMIAALPFAGVPFEGSIGPGEAHLRILETTDLHVHVYPFDYYADRPMETVGLARVATLVGQMRRGAVNTLLFDNGDYLQGNPMGDFIATERGLQPGDLHPIIAAMNCLGYDAATVGNHDFNYGLPFLMTALAGAGFPVVSGNIATRHGATARHDRHLLPPYVLLDRTLVDGTGQSWPVRIGVIGLAPPQIAMWDRKHLEGRVQTRDIVAAAEALVPEMKEVGADLVIALAHSGIGAAHHSDGMENAALPLARVPGIDAVLTGHTHQVFPSAHFAALPGVDAVRGSLHGIPATMAGMWGSHLGVIDLHLAQGGGRWRVLQWCSAAHPISRRAPGGTVQRLVESAADVLESAAAAHAATLAYVRRPVGRTQRPLHSYFAQVTASPAVAVVAAAQRNYVAARLHGTEHAGLPVLSAAAPFKAGGLAGADFYTDVAPGRVAIKNVADLYIYPNLVRALRLTGAQVLDWLERSAGLFNRITPGQPDQPLLNPAFACYDFDMIDGLTYGIDLSQPSKFGVEGELAEPDARRIIDLRHLGVPVDPAAEFVLATNDYRASGGGAFPGCDSARVVLSGSMPNREIVVRHIMEQTSLAGTTAAHWHFTPLPGTSVMFETGAAALAHLHEVTSLHIEPAGPCGDGFVRFRIHL